MATWNTYAEWDEARCLSRISLLQDQISGGATATNGPSGGATFTDEAKAERQIWMLRCRIAQIRGELQPPPPPRMDVKRRARVTWQRPIHDAGF